MASRVQAKMRTKHSINISAGLTSGMHVSPSISTRSFKCTHTQMQAHNTHLYELLRHVYSGGVEHRDLGGPLQRNQPYCDLQLG